jgi:hypothetical protein
VGRIGGHVRPNKSIEDAFAIKHILGKKLAAAILKFGGLDGRELAGFVREKFPESGEWKKLRRSTAPP